MDVMEIVRTLSSMIEEEIGDAEKYLASAIEHKDDEPELAQMFYELSEEEMGHMHRLHQEMARIVERYRAAGIEQLGDFH